MLLFLVKERGQSIRERIAEEAGKEGDRSRGGLTWLTMIGRDGSMLDDDLGMGRRMD